MHTSSIYTPESFPSILWPSSIPMPLSSLYKDFPIVQGGYQSRSFLRATMASSISTALFLFLSMISPALSLTCSSQKFSNGKVFDKCMDMPTLGAFLHWNLTKSSLSIAFIAPPAKADGWIAWAINPTATGMIGSQAIIAFKGSNGSLIAQTFNISSYGSIVQSKIAFDVSDLSAEQSGQNIQIFAKLALPANMTTINQVWQVGSAVNNGQPVRHDFAAANLQSTGKLNLLATVVSTPPPVGAPLPSAHSPASSKSAPSLNSPAPGAMSPSPPRTPNNGNKISLGSTIGILFLSIFLVSNFF